MSIATSEGESDQSGDDGSVPLPPSGRSAVPDLHPEMVDMLARATESVGLEWRPPPCPEPSKLDDWFLGVARAGSQGPTPVPFFLEVHDQLTGTWTAAFTVRNRSSGSSSLATLDGGAVRGYTEVPPVERLVAMQLCPRTASTWHGNPLLPSRACRHSSALTGSAYTACGEAASALHAMALLQVHQAKALRDLHEGGHYPEVLSELRTATDLALRATKFTARSLGRAMSTMVVQERHLWLCLADMKEADKARFLNAPVSQTCLFGDAVENFAQQFSAAQKQTEAIRHILPAWQRRLSPSILKVYVAAIAANHDPVEGKSVGKHDWVIRFLRGARRLNPPQRLTAKAVSLHPQGLRGRDCCQPRPCGRWGSMTGSSGSLGGQEGWILHAPPLYRLGTCP